MAFNWLHIAISGYFVINAFISGSISSDKWKYDSTLSFWLAVIGSFFFGSLLLFALPFVWLFSWLEIQTNARFLFHLLLTKRYNKMPERTLRLLNEEGLRRKGNGISDKSYRFSLKLVNKRNNYTYNPE